MTTMEMRARSWFSLLISCAGVCFLVGAQEGFIDIDCGLTESSGYIDEINLNYVTDDGFVETGTNKQVDSNLPNIPKLCQTLRAFPNYTRNCYELPSTVGKRYIIRAIFMYGNYDGLNITPSFDLYFGVDFWNTIKLQNATHVLWTELVAQAATPLMHVCLVKTVGGTPFISGLRLRQVADELYIPVNSSIAVTTFMRVNLGATTVIRYPDDLYDRIWTPSNDSYGTPYSTKLTVTEYEIPRFRPPMAAMQSAVYASKIEVSWNGASGDSFHVFLESADLKPSSQTRQLTTQLGGAKWGDPYAVSYLRVATRYTLSPLTQSTISIQSANESDYGAVLNAFEIYKVNQLSGSATHNEDVDAIRAIKQYYRLKKNWIGDPCLPQGHPWDGLTCTGDNSSTQRIVALDLSNSGLSGVISSFLQQLTNIQTLNLSRNSLHGSVPFFLEQLPNLISIDLSNNNLSGSIPSSLQERLKNGSLVLSIVNNAGICQQDPCDLGGKNDKNRIIITVLAVVNLVTVGVLLSLVIIMVTSKGKKHDVDPEPKALIDEGKGCNFSYAEVVEMTNNFQEVIGKGGSGNVFYGKLKDGREVAVKIMAGSLSQGIKEYTAEVNLLMKVHHKCLVSFIGFCNEDHRMILLYEYMSKGNLRDLLSGDTGSTVVLNWGHRLQIALSAAIGLEYLHSGCRPPIIHRDVKTNNILLNENLEAKIADFGLSKIRVADDITHITTAVAGTPGYVDPEYFMTNKLTEKSDVYSFGVVLFELMSGQRSILNRESQRLHIVEWVKPKIMGGDVASIVDPRLQCQYNVHTIWKVAEVAMACVQATAITRPTMTEVVNRLKEATETETSTGDGASPKTGGVLAFNSQLDTDSSMYPSAR